MALSPSDDEPVLCLPVKLDAFIFNEAVCNNTAADKAKIAPITQPNYTFLRVTESLALNDVLPHVDLHNSAPASRNSRFTNIGTGQTRTSRLGVYLHWMVPRPFRRGVAKSQPAKPPENPQARIVDDGVKDDHSAPVFLPIPNRWMVVRKLDPTKCKPSNAPIKPMKAWVIESDRTQYIDDMIEDIDLQADLSPFITAFAEASTDAKNIKLDKQAEVFIGQCFDAEGWDPDKKGKQVELTAASSSNQLFLDYQYHNANVFSMLDAFEYKDEHNKKQNLEAAEASYYVVGWHQDENKDLMSLPKAKDPDKPYTRHDRLDEVAVQLDDLTPSTMTVRDWLASQESAYSLCHGSLYQVLWNSQKIPDGVSIQADKFAGKLKASTPVSVGTSPLDSILTYVTDRAEKCTLEDDIKRLRNLLRADDETVDAHMAAEVETENFNFADFDGGFQYDFSDAGQDNTYKIPPQPEVDAMMLLNARRRLYDNIMRRQQQIRWQLFSIWWKYVSDSNAAKQGDYATEAKKATEELGRLRTLAYQLFEEMKKVIDSSPSGNNTAVRGMADEPVAKVKVKQATMEPFHQQNDPTLMLAGLKPGWPRDYGEKLAARLDNQLIVGTEGSEIVDQVKLPTKLKDPARKLLQEFVKLQTSNDSTEKAPTGKAFPLYHNLEHEPLKDVKDDDNPWRDQWSMRQPWFPLYMEWEADYFHVPYQMWKFGDFQKVLLDAQPSTTGDPECPCDPNKPDEPDKLDGVKTGYYVATDLREAGKAKKLDEPRALSGRMLILPQPTFSLKVHLERLLSTIPEPDLNKALPKCERDKLKASLDRLEFLSAPMAGFTNHLTTLYDGTHVKPLVRVPGKQSVALKDAEKATGTLGLDVAAIDKESDPTPYGTLISLSGMKDLAFKAVTHGQFRFTKLNIVDKFGQVAHAFDPLTEETNPVHPSITYYYKPQQTSKDDKTPNVVDPNTSRNPSMAQTEFVQMPPCINQPARWNADFVVHDKTVPDGQWRPANRWEEPIWGWVVVNYVDRGLQFFTREGNFFREVRVTEGEQGNVEWLPFPKPSTAELSDTAQLTHLVKRIAADQDYLKGMMHMINAAVENSATAPSAYGQFLNSLVGKPLALVNMGWSLELSYKSRQNQSTLKDQLKAAEKSNRPLGLLDEDAVAQYEFALKLGDKVQSHDGLVGYFTAKDAIDTGYDDLNLDKIYTHYSDKRYTNLAPPSETILGPEKKDWPAFKATWIDPDKIPATEKSLDDKVRWVQRQRNSKPHVFGAIIDPFRPVHGFSGILPLRSLALPTWTWEKAMKRMKTFFRAGPMLVSNTLPAFDTTKELDSVDKLEEKIRDQKSQLPLPALQVADWAWLQPYPVQSTGVEVEDEGVRQAYMPLQVAKGDTIASLPKSPYTATEGYMLLRAPIERDKKPS